MKKGLIIVAIVLVLGLIVLLCGDPHGLKIGGLRLLSFSRDPAILFDKANRWLECIQFKEFEEAGAMSVPEDRGKANVPKLIWEMFKIKHEQLDIQEWDRVMVHVDSSGTLGRTKTRSTVKLLNTEEVRPVELMLYWKKQNEEWYLDIRRSFPSQDYAPPASESGG